MEESSTEGATFNLYTAGANGIFDEVLSGVTAGQRDASVEGLQTFGGVYQLARYVKIEGVPGSGGEFSISEVCPEQCLFVIPADNCPLFLELHLDSARGMNIYCVLNGIF